MERARAIRDLVLVGLVAFLALAWLRAHDAWHDAQTAQKIEEINRRRAEQDAAAVEKQRVAQVSELQAQLDKPATVQTVTKYLPSPLPVGSQVKIETLPSAPAPQLVVTGDAQQNLQAIQDMEIKCRICDANLQAREQQLKDAQSQLAALALERDQFKKAAGRGTGFGARVKEWGLRLGIAFVAYEVGRHR